MKIKASYGVERKWRTMVVALVAAGMFVVMLIAQLFAYEDFAVVLSSLTATNDASALTVIASGLVIAELLALPYLLGMYMSKLMRILSAVLGFTVSGFWLLTALTNAHVANSGVFSTAYELPGGILAALWAFVLFGCVCRVLYADSRPRHATLEV